MSAPERIRVAAGVISNAAGELLIAQRPEGGHLGGWWEFPGGKLEPGESAETGLRRELAEELGITVSRAEALVRFEHAYPERVVELLAFHVLSYRGEVRGAEGQPLKWVAAESLLDAGLLPADRPILSSWLEKRRAG